MYAIALCLCASALAASTERESLSGRPRMRGSGMPTPDRNPHSGDSRRCQVNGISLFEGAMWSPEPCSTCRCQRGAADCTSTPCSGIGTETVTLAYGMVKCLRILHNLLIKCKQFTVTTSSSNNKISTIPFRGLAGLPNLEWLDLSQNKLGDSSLSPDLFQNVTNLKKLNLDGNSLTRIPLLPPSLEELKINNNKISALTPHSFEGLSKLLTLELRGNRFHEGNVSPLTFSPLRRTVYLRLDGDLFRELPSGACLHPFRSVGSELRLSKNRSENVRGGILNKCPQLHTLDLGHNRIQEDHIAPRAWIHSGMLQALDISYNKLAQVPSFLPTALRQLILHHNKIFGHLHPGLESLHLSHNQLSEEGVHAVSFLGLQHSLLGVILGIIKRTVLLFVSLLYRDVTLDSICDTRVLENSSLVSVHPERNLINRDLIPPSIFSFIETSHNIILQPQAHEEEAGQP
uniref:Si:dkey-32e6.6 n=1 Tax=Scleropages formosus TaxID=113540 RepID=A0A8C9RIT4_SCLFO